MSSIALLSTPAFAQDSADAPHISNGRTDFTDISAKRRQYAKPRHKSVRYAKAHQAGARHAKPRHAKRHSAKRSDAIRNMAGLDAFASIPNQHGIAPTYQYGPGAVS